MKCKIIWNSLSIKEWSDQIARVNRLPLLQSYPYAQAMRKAHQQSSRFGVIEIDGEMAGLCIIQEVGLFKKFVHNISLDRGPVWFEGFGKAAHWKAFLQAFDAEFPMRFGRKRRLIPELLDKPAHATLMTEAGWALKAKTKKYQTIWLDLRPDLDILRKNLKQKWRNALNKSEKRGLLLDLDEEGASLDILLRRYMQDRLEKRYAGASPKMLKALAEFTIPHKECLIFNALAPTSDGDGDIAASILIFTHGRSATYQIGWSGYLGRDSNAHYFLIWNAICALKERGITDFDLGGVNDGYAASVKAFKMGLNGQEIALIGHYT